MWVYFRQNTWLTNVMQTTGTILTLHFISGKLKTTLIHSKPNMLFSSSISRVFNTTSSLSHFLTLLSKVWLILSYCRVLHSPLELCGCAEELFHNDCACEQGMLLQDPDPWGNCIIFNYIIMLSWVCNDTIQGLTTLHSQRVLH